MAEIELVIKIDKEDYKKVLEINNRECEGEWNTVHSCYEAVFKGVPLPKGHGDLVDIDTIYIDEVDFYDGADYERAINAVNIAPTIIKADKEQRYGRNDKRRSN